MTNIGDILEIAQTTNLQKKGGENIRIELALLLDTYLPNFSIVFHDKIEKAVNTIPDLLVIKSIVFERFKNRIRDFEQLEQEAIDASKYIGIGDSAYSNYCILFENITLQISFILEGKDALEEQINVLKKYIQAVEEDTNQNNGQSTKRKLPIQTEKRKKKKKKGNKEKEELTIQSLLDRLAMIGFLLPKKENSILKKIEQLPTQQKEALHNHLFTLENYEGNLFMSNYITSLKHSN